jgi:serine/threonine protein kinase
VAIEQNTGRRVAIKFYSHRGGLDWSLLSREVEKLAFLFADRYVVQLVGVGWNAEPPYYVMEYLEQGSVAERLQDGPLAVPEAVELFRDVAVGLLHAHGKGVLHCDLKPANILLDQDGKPRLADFGQSRLSHEQLPALGTLFYMAPEQADLAAVPDSRWDVYALGALLYSMLTGGPPHRTHEVAEQLEQATDITRRLSLYRRLIRKAPPPTAHRRVPGVDRALADIVNRCLAADPERRYPNVQAVLAALDARAAQRARRPMMILGAVLPALLLAVVSVFAFWGSSELLETSEEALIDRAVESNGFAASFVARTAANELERRYEAVEKVAESEDLRAVILQMASDPDLQQLSVALSNPNSSDEELEPLRERFRQHSSRQALQKVFQELIPSDLMPETGAVKVNSWFFADANGISTARVPEDRVLGKNYSWRSFFHGGNASQPPTWRPPAGMHVEQTQPSAVFRSESQNGRWIVAISTPVYDPDQHDKFLGVVALTVPVGYFVELQSSRELFATLVDWRDGPDKGTILQHPLFDELRRETGRMPDRFEDFRLQAEDLPATPQRQQDYHDPLAQDPMGQDYSGRWLAQMQPVQVRQQDTGWLVIVQQAYSGTPATIGWTMDQLRHGLIRWGLLALTMVVLIILGLWAFVVLRVLRAPRLQRGDASTVPLTERPSGGLTSESTTDASKT